MTVPVPDQLEYISDADGVTKDFPYPIRFLEKDEVIVALRDADGVDTPQVLNTHYTIAGNSWPTGGTVSFINAPQAPNKVVRYRMTEAKQTVGLANNQRNDAPSVELQLDRTIMALQDRNQVIEATKQGLSVETNARKTADAALNASLNAEIEGRENGDKALASLIGRAGPIEQPIFDSRLAVSGATIDPLVHTIIVNGRDASGDMTAIRYTDENIGTTDTVEDHTGRIWYPVPERSVRKLGTIVVLGSSTLAGWGTSGVTSATLPSKDNGWSTPETAVIGKLERALTGQARVINRAVGGYSSATAVARFHLDVLPFNPTFCIIGTGWVNEGGANDQDKAANWIANTLRLIGMCRSNGIVPIVMAFNPYAQGTFETKECMYDAMAAIDATGVIRWDMLGGVGDGFFSIYPEMKANDGTEVHGNDLAHQMYFDNIPLGDLYRALEGENRSTQTNVGGQNCLVINSDAPNSPIRVWFDSAIRKPKSWTVAFTTNRRLGSDNVWLWSVHYGTAWQASPVRIRSWANRYELVNEAGVVVFQSPINVDNDRRPVDMLVTYDHRLDLLTWRINGTDVASFSPGWSGREAWGMSWGGSSFPALGWEYSLIRVWKSVIVGSGPLQRAFSKSHRNNASIIIDIDVGADWRGVSPNLIPNNQKIVTVGTTSQVRAHDRVIIRMTNNDTATIVAGATKSLFFGGTVFNSLRLYNPSTGFFRLPFGTYDMHMTVTVALSAPSSADGYVSIDLINNTSGSPVIVATGTAYVRAGDNRVSLNFMVKTYVFGSDDGFNFRLYNGTDKSVAIGTGNGNFLGITKVSG